MCIFRLGVMRDPWLAGAGNRGGKAGDTYRRARRDRRSDGAARFRERHPDREADTMTTLMAIALFSLALIVVAILRP